MGECYQCKYWNNAQYVMNKYGERCGICMVDGQVRFCSQNAVIESVRGYCSSCSHYLWGWKDGGD